jgi:DNA-binding PadR family transcriptional regulator
MRRRPGELLPLELEILDVAAVAAATGDPELHGFAMAKRLGEARGSNRLTAHGTLYKALARLTEAGLFEDRWEDPDVALAEGRPRRRLYRISAAGQAARVERAAAAIGRAPRVDPGIAPA